MRYSTIFAALSLLTCFAAATANAELAVGSEGKFKDTTEIASSTMHQGALATIQAFLGSIDRHDVAAAETQKTAIVKQLNEAAAAYGSAIGYAGAKKLNPVPDTEQDKQDVQYFFEHMKEFGFTDDLSEKSVTTSVKSLILTMSNTIGSTDVKTLSSNIREQQKFFKYILIVQYFLNSITTVFRTG